MISPLMGIQFGGRTAPRLSAADCATDAKVRVQGKRLHVSGSCQESKVRERWNFSPLRLMWWASLVVGTRAQLIVPFPAQMELSSLDGTNGSVIHGERVGDCLGFSVSNGGDLNGDGIFDAVVGAHLASPRGTTQTGRSYVIFGKIGLGSSGSVDIKALNVTTGFAVNGERVYDLSGWAVSSAGDLNDDGLADLVIGAPGTDLTSRYNEGRSYVLFWNRRLGTTGSIDLSSLKGVTGFRLNGDQSFEESGWAITNAGDLNGDRVSDLVIGAYGSDPGGRSKAGKSYVLFGKTGIGLTGTIDLKSLSGKEGFILNGEKKDDRSGISLSSAGDVNGDGISDLVIGAYWASPRGQMKAGKTYVLFGRIGLGRSGNVELSTLNGTTGFVLNGENPGDQSGLPVSSAGDVNGDGISDLVIGAHEASPNGELKAGQTYVVFGNSGLGASGSINLTALNGTTGFVLNGEEAGDESGRSVSSGDVNGDGISDLVIGAPGASPGSRSSAGRTYVVFGKVGFGSSGSLNLSSLNGVAGFMLNGDEEGDKSGRSTSCEGDVNGDGIVDLLIGAPHYNYNGNYGAGKTYVVFGRNLAPPPSPSSSVASSSRFSSPQSILSTLNTSSPNPARPAPPSSTKRLAPEPPVVEVGGDATTPYIGVAVGVIAFAYSLLAGGYYFWKGRAPKDEPIPEDELVGVRPESDNDDLSPESTCSRGYTTPPQGSQVHSTDHYVTDGEFAQINTDMDLYRKRSAHDSPAY